MKLAFLTASFPFPPGEQFIETEIHFWPQSNFSQITILPIHQEGASRPVPPNIAVDTSLTLDSRRLVYVFKALASPFFHRELRYLWAHGLLTIERVLEALRSTALLIRVSKGLTNWLRKHGPVDIIYAYWNHVSCYAACIAKNNGLVNKVISRTHGFDVYEERQRANYMPLKRQFHPDIDRIFVLSNEARDYFAGKYGVPESKLEISRLGVSLPIDMTAATPVGSLSILSVSFCVPVKRIDKIIDSISLFAEKFPTSSITWVHIGDGPLRAQLMGHAKTKFERLLNVRFEFLGNLDNADVKGFYSDNPVDLFINLSESEGVPVSIMEAMAAGVPAIAPDVGGIAELVTPDCGCLVPASVAPEQAVRALEEMVYRAKRPAVRRAARERVRELFCAETNYRAFVDKVWATGKSDALA